MRYAAYAGTSMVLATGVIVRALHERANFYSACVYLAQSNACLMVLTNIALLGVCAGMLGLQRLFYGPLRPIEVEQLYEKAWFAITETCLAMTIFREEVGGWFLVMFVCLLVGKVWGWIGEGRVEILEQQPPSNPRLFHARLSVSLLLSALFDIFMLRYSINTVLRHARPNMMVMFAFEFAVLTVTSISTAARYTISLHEANVIKTQIKDRRAQMRRELERSRAQNQTIASDGNPPQAPAAVASTDEDIDSLDIDVPGWEEKGRWIFYLDLTTDFCKLVLYLAFFCVLCMFYGMPIHIIRDVALTIRSFYKRITDFVRYRQATRDMNARYPDATAQEVAREDVCIICREDMRPWQQQADNVAADATGPAAVDERLRPKKLPCGHILHFACLRSWLERQQNCPTCRRPVLVTGTVAQTQEPDLANPQGRGHGHANHPQAQPPAHGNIQHPLAPQNVFNLGPFRIAFGARHGVQGLPQQANNNPPPAQQEPVPVAAQVPRMANAFGLQRQAAGLPAGMQNRVIANFSPTNVQSQLHQIEQYLIREINGLRIQQNQLSTVRALQGELARLRVAQANPEMPLGGPPTAANHFRFTEALPTLPNGQTFLSGSQQQPMGHGHPNLPVGMTLPPGWTVLPLQRVLDQVNAGSNENGSVSIPSTQTQNRAVNSLAGSVPDGAASTTASQSTSPLVSKSPSIAPAGETQSKAASPTEHSQPNPSSQGLIGASSPQRSHSFSGLNEEQQAKGHVSQVNCQKVSSDIQPYTGLPEWGSAAQRTGVDQQFPDATGSSRFTESLEDGAASSGEGATSRSNFDSRQAKGKGKASTVEDATEDFD